ncbi:MAG TPA: hypothetical protein VMU01_02160 [Rhizomicrobium sp.]|nr:hypothetical protein [Rhizomicrobium sp.]
MDTFNEATKPVTQALASTALSCLAFALLRFGVGASPGISLYAGLILAGLLNIRHLWSLNRDGLLPTSEQVSGS